MRSIFPFPIRLILFMFFVRTPAFFYAPTPCEIGKDMRKECVNQDAKTGCCLAPELLCMKLLKSSIALLRRDGSLFDCCFIIQPSSRNEKRYFRITGFQIQCKYACAKVVSLSSSYRIRANACYRAVCLSHGLE